MSNALELYAIVRLSSGNFRELREVHELEVGGKGIPWSYGE
jgi:hypothetical protein